jgi:hypothetical protein
VKRTLRPLTTLLTELVAISRDAHAAGQREVAYHALAAAMHAAADAADSDALRLVLAEASTQLAWIDDHDAGHRLSTRSAARHQHPGVYAMLIRQCETHLELVRHAAAARAHRAHRAPARS